jgi:hypothetical protein
MAHPARPLDGTGFLVAMGAGAELAMLHTLGVDGNPRIRRHHQALSVVRRNASGLDAILT